MIPTTYEQWVSDGRPWRNAVVIDRFATLMRNHGFTVYTMGNQEHLTAHTPEDHTPYSHTPWPGPQPYPQILALDVMPGGPVDWRDLGQQIADDRDAGLPGTGWIKYMNWTTRAGSCWHYAWEPNLAIRSSSDTGHIHISACTDHVDDDLHGWDPVARLLSGVPSAPQSLTPQGEDDMQITGDLPFGFGIDEHDAWINLALGSTLCQPVPVPAVGYEPAEWGPAWLYLAGAGPATVRYGCFGIFPAPVWADAHVSLTRPVGPLALPNGTQLVLLARKQADGTTDSTAVRWHIQYGRHAA